jgi:hypothetical protein
MGTMYKLAFQDIARFFMSKRGLVVAVLICAIYFAITVIILAGTRTTSAQKRENRTLIAADLQKPTPPRPLEVTDLFPTSQNWMSTVFVVLFVSAALLATGISLVVPLREYLGFLNRASSSSVAPRRARTALARDWSSIKAPLDGDPLEKIWGPTGSPSAVIKPKLT